MNIGIGLLNYHRKDYPFEKLFTCKHFNKQNIVIGVSDKIELDDFEQDNIINCNGFNVSKSKNLIIQKLKEKGYDLVFLFEDDMILEKPEIIDSYIDLFERTNPGVIFCSYDVNLNRVLPNMNNPADVLNITKKDHTYSFYTNLCGGLIVMDLNKCLVRFDESYNHVELRKFALDCYEAALLPFFAPYLDVQDTQSSFSHKDCISFRKVNHPVIVNAFKQENDQVGKLIGEKKFEPTMDIEKVAQWVVKNG